MKDVIGSMPADGSPEYRELVRRQGVLGVSANLPYAAREQLLPDGGVGRTWVADRPIPVKRPRKSMLSNPVPYDPLPSIVASPVDATPPAKIPSTSPTRYRRYADSHAAGSATSILTPILEILEMTEYSTTQILVGSAPTLITSRLRVNFLSR